MMMTGPILSLVLYVPSEKDLGVWITSKPDFSLQCDKAFAKAMQSLGLIKRPFTNLTKETFLILYKTYIRPLCFNLESIFSKSIDKLKQIQQRAMKLASEIAHLLYEARLQHLNLHFLYCQRRSDRSIQVGQPSNLSFTRPIFHPC